MRLLIGSGCQAAYLDLAAAIPLEPGQAHRTGTSQGERARLWHRGSGLSLGDRFCLALAKRLDCPALTADRAWLPVADDAGVRIELIR